MVFCFQDVFRAAGFRCMDMEAMSVLYRGISVGTPVVCFSAIWKSHAGRSGEKVRCMDAAEDILLRYCSGQGAVEVHPACKGGFNEKTGGKLTFRKWA